MLTGNYEWDALNELKGMNAEQAIKWFKDHGEKEVEFEDDDDLKEFGETTIIVGGYWSDDTIRVDIEGNTQDNHVVRWFRGEPWD